MKDPGLEQFLSELRTEGDQESSGVFTVSKETAERKLEKFQLRSDTLYVVQMVAAGVASGATFVSIETGLASVEFVSNGLAPCREELENLESFLFNTHGTHPFLSELAVGIQAAISLPCKKVLVESFTQEGSWQLEVRPDRRRLKQLRTKAPTLPLMRIVVDKGFGLRSRVINCHPETKLLKRCSLAPVELILDQESLLSEERNPPQKALAWALLGDPPAGSGFSFPDAPRLTVSSVGHSGWLAVMSENAAHRRGLNLVHHGIAHKRLNADLGTTNVCGVVFVNGLRRDISFTDLVENSDYRNLLGSLRNTAAKLNVELCRDPKADREQWKKLKQPVKQLLKKHALEEQDRAVLENWLAFVEVSEAKGPEDHYRALKKARELENESQLGEAQAIRREVISHLSAEICRQFDLVEWEAVLELLGPLELALRESKASGLANFYQNCNVLRCMLFDEEVEEKHCSQTDPWSVLRKGLMLRAHGRMVEATETFAAVRHLTEDPKTLAWAFRLCAEIELAEADYLQAEEFFDQAYKHSRSRDLFEERAFLKRMLGAEGRYDCVRYLREALIAKERAPYVHWLMMDWLVKEGRGILSLEDWVKFRARASFEEVKAKVTLGLRKEIESRLEPRFDLLGWKSLDTLREERVEAVALSENEFGPVHPYTQFTRRRAIYQLHRLESHQQAEALHCRGHLLAQFRRFIAALDENID